MSEPTPEPTPAATVEEAKSDVKVDGILHPKDDNGEVKGKEVPDAVPVPAESNGTEPAVEGQEAKPDEEATAEAPVKLEGNDGNDEGEEDAPTLVETKPNGDAKLIKELDDEAPKTFPQVVSALPASCCSFRFYSLMSFVDSSWRFFQTKKIPIRFHGCPMDVRL